jgi:hypothetical protein
MIKQFFRKLKNSENRANVLLRFSTKYINPWLRKLGMTLVIHHFYQPIPDQKDVEVYKNRMRPVEHIDWKIEEQIDFADKLLNDYSSEYNDPEILKEFGYSEADGTFGSGSREFYYSMIRKYKPRNIIEIGAGNSSLICLAALKKNYEETGRKTNFTSIEPFPSKNVLNIEKSKYDFVNYKLILEKLQTVDPVIFQTLESNDILFVDSSHVFKQGSDVEYEFMKIYPTLKKSVLVHIHDIFIPFDYPFIWNQKYFHFWNEQYFLETFLLCNSCFQTIAGLCMLNHHKPDVFLNHIRGYQSDNYSGSFWMQVIE